MTPELLGLPSRGQGMGTENTMKQGHDALEGDEEPGMEEGQGARALGEERQYWKGGLGQAFQRRPQECLGTCGPMCSAEGP